MSDGGSLLHLSDAASSTPIHKMMGGGDINGGSLLQLSDSASRVPIDPQRGGVGVSFIKAGEPEREKARQKTDEKLKTDNEILKKYGLGEDGIIKDKLSQQEKNKFIQELESGKCLKGPGDNVILSSECAATVKVIRELVNYHIERTNITKTRVHIKEEKVGTETILDIDVTIMHDNKKEVATTPEAATAAPQEAATTTEATPQEAATTATTATTPEAATQEAATQEAATQGQDQEVEESKETETSVSPSTAVVPPATAEVPPATTVVPPATAEVPPATTVVPPATTVVPPATAEVPPATPATPEVPPLPPIRSKGGYKFAKKTRKIQKQKKKHTKRAR
jgi:hypothetical protein